mmetsp:Transcript_3217/g.6448  ORF Transcript_3217/g.6448 Transcript_3217/m.6448 type:complete len:275 (-) Transcript_3217:1152-1976(-)
MPLLRRLISHRMAMGSLLKSVKYPFCNDVVRMRSGSLHAMSMRALDSHSQHAARAFGAEFRGASSCWRRNLSTTFASRAGDGDALSTASIKNVFKKEWEHEKSTYEPPEELAQGPPEPFTLTETKGDTLLTLTRSYGSDETVMVDVMVNDQDEEEPLAFEDEDGELDVDVSIEFVVTVLKKDKDEELVFECSSDGSYLEIKNLSLEPSDEDELDEALYTGPVFEELDDEVQESLYSFLQEREITPDLAEYLLNLVHDKEQREYMDWLQKMITFL